ncbi:hypothetical protein AB3X52_06515 [Nocardioides sp. DS6]|uniref:PH domain-containing protein n=1 Tax=Nocardioides eburneus TaxID=3231482 RepID=A0ABV3SWE7_9ACTN
MGDLFDRWLEHHQSDDLETPADALTAPRPAIAPQPPHGDAPEVVVPAPRAAERPALAPHTIFFRPRKHARRLYTLLLVAGLIACLVLAALAWRQRTSTTYELAGLALGLTAILYAVRAGSATATLTVTGGSLEVRRGGSRTVFDLTSAHTGIEVVGRPGGRRWRVVLRRPSLPAYVIDGSMVEPAEFMRVLRYYRTDLRSADTRPATPAAESADSGRAVTGPSDR